MDYPFRMLIICTTVSWYGTGQITMQQPVFHDGVTHLAPVGQYEYTLKLAYGDSAMQEHTVFAVICLMSANNQIPVLDRS